MTRRFSISRLSADLEQSTVLLIAGAIAAALGLVVLLPLPAAGTARALSLGAIFAGDALVFAALARRRIARHRARVNERLARAERDVTEAERLASVGRVAAGIAHEIGNPLTGIANYAHVLRSRAGASPEVETALSGIEREVERIDRIVSTLLDYARPHQARAKAFDGSGTLRQAVQLLAAQGVFRRVQVQSTIDASPLALVGDSHELEQVFVNLLLNAIDAMDAEGTLALYAGRLAPAAISRAPRRADDADAQAFERSGNPRFDEWRAHRAADEPCAKFVIADSGPGVDPNDAGRIFEPFFTTKNPDEGSGLGLAIVQRVIEAHDGLVWVQRAREGGAAFHVVLPLGAFGSTPPQLQ